MYRFLSFSLVLGQWPRSRQILLALPALICIPSERRSEPLKMQPHFWASEKHGITLPSLLERRLCQSTSLFCRSWRGIKFPSLLFLVILYLKCPLANPLNNSVWIMMKVCSQRCTASASLRHCRLLTKMCLWSLTNSTSHCRGCCFHNPQRAHRPLIWALDSFWGAVWEEVSHCGCTHFLPAPCFMNGCAIWATDTWF